MKLILASDNEHKMREINHLLGGTFQVISYRDAGVDQELEEPFFTFEENARAKADAVFRLTGVPTFAEDSGLVVPILDGAPGVFSARYAGVPKSDDNNIVKLLKDLEGNEIRDAYYQTTICYVTEKDIYYFSDICEGAIALERFGTGGFGYDPIFIPKGYEKTFGELPFEVKQEISHRSKAINKFVQFLKTGEYQTPEVSMH